MDLLPTGKEAISLGHLVSVLSFCGHPPGNSYAGCDSGAEYDRIGSPVVWLRIPTTSGRPDVFRVGNFTAAAHRRGCSLLVRIEVEWAP